MIFSSLPFLFLAQAIVLFFATKKSDLKCSERKAFYRFLFLIITWFFVSSILALDKIYLSEQFLNSYPGFWITSVVPTIAITYMILSQSFKNAVITLYKGYGRKGSLVFQSMRIVAIGGIFKAFNGEFSPYYGKLIGIPDFIFSVICFCLIYFYRKREINRKLYLVVMSLGVLVIIPFGMALINTGLPGRMFVYDGNPSITTIFEFPMALAPTVIVPFFIVVQVFGLLIELKILK